jgi:hypothetical protein
MRIFVLAAIAAATAIVPCTLQAACKIEADRDAGADVAGVEKIVLVTGAGDLDVKGSSGAKRIEAHGKACASTQSLMDGIVLKVHREGSTLFLETVMPELEQVILFGSSYAILDLKVTLPDNLPVEAQDSSGDAKLSNLKNLQMLDSSGDLEIRNIAGALDLKDSSGDIVLDHIGSAKLQDSSGDMTLDNITNDVEITVDSSGDITIDHVGGNVHVLQDSSGEIKVQNVRGNVLVDADTSGSIEVDNIGGDFAVGADSGGGVKINNVHGNVKVP